MVILKPVILTFHIYNNIFASLVGLMAEWLRRGLQILVSQFDSGWDLHFFLVVLNGIG